MRMCGLAGIYGRRERVSRELLLDMAGELRHRGPDGVGLYLDGRFGMTNTRLAIVDLDSGDQPISDERGRFWVMQNGEIYNYVELREELEALGHGFSTESDTEVIAHAYEEWGAALLQRLNGDFALAIWDRERQELFLARDRFGVRPLFLASYGGDLCFASEAKALLRHPGARRELDPGAIADVFTLWSTLPDRSTFVGIRELPAAHYLVVGADGAQRQRPLVGSGFRRRSTDDRAEADVVDELHALLEDSVRIRLRADVPSRLPERRAGLVSRRCARRPAIARRSAVRVRRGVQPTRISTRASSRTRSPGISTSASGGRASTPVRSPTCFHA